MNLEETCLGDVKNMMNMRSNDKFWTSWADKHEDGELIQDSWIAREVSARK